MDSTSKSAFIVAQAAMLNAEIAGMQAENQWRANCGHSPAYDGTAFQFVIERYGCLDCNSVLAYLRD